MSNPYYDPEGCGLTIVADLDNSEPYEFDMVVVWRDAEGNLYGAHDAGCSCPTPFEDFTSTADMTPVRTVDDARDLLGKMSSYNPPSGVAVLDFLAKVREALKVRP